MQKVGRVEDAKDHWQAVIELDENNSTAYYKLGCYYRDTAGEPDKAIAMFEKAVECDPTYAKARFYLAQLRNDYDEMIECAGSSASEPTSKGCPRVDRGDTESENRKRGSSEDEISCSIHVKSEREIWSGVDTT